MSKASSNANAVVYTVEQVCGLYGVQYTREQSRVINVEGTAGRWRPMFVGQWTDDFGKVHSSGKADILARPRIVIRFHNGSPSPASCADPAGLLPAGKLLITVPLWIECKSGDGRMTAGQEAFRYWVEKNGDAFLLIHDDVKPLIDWFDAHGVTRISGEAETRNVLEPMDATALVRLPCRHCKKNRPDHIGPAFGCPGTSGKCWSPDMKAARS